MTKTGLTRKEIGWLLAQEARGAAESLKREFRTEYPSSLSTQQSSSALLEGRLHPPEAIVVEDNNYHESFSTLEQAMQLLGQLHHPVEAAHHRGRVDVAAMLIELFPRTKVSIAATGGTEVFGDTEELKRILELFVAPAGGASEASSDAAQVHVGRSGDLVEVTVDLGPDAGHLQSIEERWLARLASRLGGRVQTTGRKRCLLLPADGAAQEREIAALKKELAEAQQIGETYAIELAQLMQSPPLDEPARPSALTILEKFAELHQQQPQGAQNFLRLLTQSPEQKSSAQQVLALAKQAQVSSQAAADENAPPSPSDDATTIEGLARLSPRLLGALELCLTIAKLLGLTHYQLDPQGSSLRLHGSALERQSEGPSGLWLLEAFAEKARLRIETDPSPTRQKLDSSASTKEPSPSFSIMLEEIGKSP